MPVVNLSAELVRNAVCPENHSKINLYSSTIPGFLVEVRKSGSKTYALRYRDSHGRQIQHKIGDAVSVSFDKAKNMAQILRSKVVLGEDPSADKRTKRMVPTFAEFTAEHYLPFIQKDKRSWESDVSLLNNHLLPRYGKTHMDKVRTTGKAGGLKDCEPLKAVY